MAGKEFQRVPRLNDDDNEWLKGLIAGMDLPDKQQRRPQAPTKTPEPSVDGFTPVPPEALQRMLNSQQKLIRAINELSPLSAMPDHLTLDPFPVYTRLYTEGGDSAEDGMALPYESRFAEFTAYHDPQANDLADIMGTPVTGQLRVGKFRDQKTMSKYLDLLKTEVLRFDAETIYGIQPEGVIKFVALPRSFNDPRPDTFPNRPEAHHVTSRVDEFDLKLMREIFGYFEYHLGNTP